MDAIQLILVICAILIFTLLLVEIYWRQTDAYKVSVKLPGPPIYPIVGNTIKVINFNAG